ncbi:MAG: HPF/RaiA family ribosome-associated protein [Rhodopirellula sp.]|nr:HPF/RaiA family ribosome-associated protein [Rhodopirellula sp.]
MRIQIQTSKMDADSSVNKYVERRLSFALGRFADVVQKVEVTLADINGPKGGHDKLCKIRVDLRRLPKPVYCEILHEELRTSIDLAAERSGRAVARAIDRQTGYRIARRRRAAAVLSLESDLTASLD